MLLGAASDRALVCDLNIAPRRRHVQALGNVFAWMSPGEAEQSAEHGPVGYLGRLGDARGRIS